MTDEEYDISLEIQGQKSGDDNLYERNLLLEHAGASDKLIDKELGLGDKEPSMSDIIPIDNWWLKQKEEWVGKEFNLTEALKKGVGMTLHNASEEYHQDGETAWWGWADPSLKAYDPKNYPDERHLERAISTLTMIGVDLPYYILGAIPGAYLGYKLRSPRLAAMASGYTSGFLVDSLKYMYLEALKRGKIKDFDEWWAIFLEYGVKPGHEAGLQIGIAAGARAYVGGMGLKGTIGKYLPVTKDAIAKFAAQYTSYLAMGALISKEMPKKDDYIHLALILLPFNIPLFKGVPEKIDSTKQKKMIDNKMTDLENIKKDTYSPQEILSWIGEKKTRVEDFVTKNVFRFREDAKKTEVEITNLKTELKELLEQEKKDPTTIENKQQQKIFNAIETEKKKGIKSDKILTKVEESVEKSIKKEEMLSLEEEARKFKTADEFMYAEKTLPIKLVTSIVPREKIISTVGKIESRTPDAPVVVTIEGGKIIIKDGNNRYYQKIDKGAKTIKVVFIPENDALLISIWKIAQKKTSEIAGEIAKRAKISALEKELNKVETAIKEITSAIDEARNNRIIEIERTLRELGELEGPEVRKYNKDIKTLKDRIEQLETELGETVITGKKTLGRKRMEDLITIGKREELIRKKDELVGLEEFKLMTHAFETFNLLSERTDRILSPAQKHIEKITNLNITVSKKVFTLPTWNNIRNQWLDRKYPIKRVLDEAKKVGVEFVKGGPTAYHWARLSPGQLGKVFYFTDYGTFDFQGKPLGKPAKEFYKFITDYKDYKERLVRYEESAWYVIALRIVEVAEIKGIRKGITDKKSVIEAKKAVKELEAKYGKEIKDFAKDYHEFVLAPIIYGEGAGLFSKGTAKYLAEHNKDFVSFRRVLKIDEKTGLPIKDASGKLQLSGKIKSPIHTMKGTKEHYQVLDPHQTIFENAHDILLMAEKNYVLNEFIKKIEAAQEINPEFYKDIVYSKSKEDKNYGKEKLPKNKDSKALDITGERDPYFFNTEGYRRGETEIVFFRDGVKEIWEVGKELSDAFRDQDPVVTYLHNSWFTAPTKWARAGAVLDPDFSMVRNPVRGTLEAALFSKNNFWPVWDTAIGGFFTMRGIKSGKRTDLYKDFVKGGGLQSFITTADRTFLSRDVQNILKQRKWYNQLTPGRGLELLRATSEHIETYTRVGDLKMTLPRLRKEYPHLSERDLLAMAALEAREVSLDFQKGGIQSMRLNAVSEFFNPRILGLYKYFELFNDRAGKLAMNITRFLILPTILEQLINNDEDDPEKKQVYENLDEADKWYHWHWIEGIGDKLVVFRIVKGYDAVSFFSNGTKALMDWWRKEDPVSLKQFKDNFIDEHVGLFGSTLMPWPTIVKPLLHYMTNRNLFFGGKIVSRYMEDHVEAPFQYGANTTEFSKYIGKKIGELTGNKYGSPLKIDDAIGTWTGGLGTDIIRYTERFLIKIGVPIPSPVKPWSNEWEDNLHEWPIIKVVIKRYPNANFGQITKIYKVYDEAQKKVSTYKSKKKHDEGVEFNLPGASSFTAEAYLSDEELHYYEELISLADTYLKPFNEQARALQLWRSMPKGTIEADQLYDEIEEVYKLMAMEARYGWEAVKWFLNNRKKPK